VWITRTKANTRHPLNTRWIHTHTHGGFPGVFCRAGGGPKAITICKHMKNVCGANIKFITHTQSQQQLKGGTCTHKKNLVLA